MHFGNDTTFGVVSPRLQSFTFYSPVLHVRQTEPLSRTFNSGTLVPCMRSAFDILFGMETWVCRSRSLQSTRKLLHLLKEVLFFSAL